MFIVCVGIVFGSKNISYSAVISFGNVIYLSIRLENIKGKQKLQGGGHLIYY